MIIPFHVTPQQDARMLADTFAALQPADRAIVAAVFTYLDGLAKPTGSFGQLDSLAITLATRTG